jgi:hypothetical protein
VSYDFDYFSGNHLFTPSKPTKPTLGRNPNAIEARAYADALEVYEKELESYDENLRWYYREKNSLLSDFKDKLRSDYNLPEEKFSVIWEEARARASDEGLYKIHDEFDSLFYFICKYNNGY